MIRFYYNLAPNPTKVALALEEMGLQYELVPVDTRKGEQHTSQFLSVNPNAKVPAIVDGDATVFDSNAILLYLAEKTGKFLPGKGDKARGELLSWLMFVASGIGPFSGQCVHFRHVAPEPKDYSVQRYVYEANRHWSILEERLAKRRYVLGDTYTIVDMAVWVWSRALGFVFGDDAGTRFPNVKRHSDEIGARPAAVRADALKTRFNFKTEMDEEARRFLFPTLAKA